jgi:hypothetical protein
MGDKYIPLGVLWETNIYHSEFYGKGFCLSGNRACGAGLAVRQLRLRRDWLGSLPLVAHVLVSPASGGGGEVEVFRQAQSRLFAAFKVTL